MEFFSSIGGSSQQFDVNLDFFPEPMHPYTLPDNTQVLSPVAWTDCGFVDMPQYVMDEMNTSFGSTGTASSLSIGLMLCLFR